MNSEILISHFSLLLHELHDAHALRRIRFGFLTNSAIQRCAWVTRLTIVSVKCHSMTVILRKYFCCMPNGKQKKRTHTTHLTTPQHNKDNNEKEIESRKSVIDSTKWIIILRKSMTVVHREWTTVFSVKSLANAYTNWQTLKTIWPSVWPFC